MARVLVVDDEDTVRRVLIEALRRVGHEGLEAENGRDALELVRTEHVDLVVTDVVMPEVDGLELIKELSRVAPGMKVIAISGGGIWDKQSLLTTAGMLGALMSLEKPFELQEFLSLVEEVLKPPPTLH
jgi:DNA-binding NtrC family response regulator